MKVLENELYTEFDIDDTLVMWDENPYQLGGDKIAFKCPYDDETTFYLTPNKHHINLLKAKKKRGYFVIVHSANGWAWAEKVISTLGLSDYVDIVKTKTRDYVDDLPADSWKSRIYIDKTKKKLDKSFKM